MSSSRPTVRLIVVDQIIEKLRGIPVQDQEETAKEIERDIFQKYRTNERDYIREVAETIMKLDDLQTTFNKENNDEMIAQSINSLNNENQSRFTSKTESSDLQGNNANEIKDDTKPVSCSKSKTESSSSKPNIFKILKFKLKHSLSYEEAQEMLTLDHKMSASCANIEATEIEDEFLALEITDAPRTTITESESNSAGMKMNLNATQPSAATTEKNDELKAYLNNVERRLKKITDPKKLSLVKQKIENVLLDFEMDRLEVGNISKEDKWKTPDFRKTVISKMQKFVREYSVCPPSQSLHKYEEDAFKEAHSLCQYLTSISESLFYLIDSLSFDNLDPEAYEALIVFVEEIRKMASSTDI